MSTPTKMQVTKAISNLEQIRAADALWVDDWDSQRVDLYAAAAKVGISVSKIAELSGTSREALYKVPRFAPVIAAAQEFREAAEAARSAAKED